jgi:hypothetical protein
MPLEDFRAILAALPPGRAAHVPYELYGTLFPPGEPDEDARARALEFAKANGCVIDNRPKDEQVLFVKPAQG